MEQPWTAPRTRKARVGHAQEDRCHAARAHAQQGWHAAASVVRELSGTTEGLAARGGKRRLSPMFQLQRTNMKLDHGRSAFETLTARNFPSWSLERGADGCYMIQAVNRMWSDWIASQPACEHGAVGYCGHCDAKQSPKCQHGMPWYCGHCGPVMSLGEPNHRHGGV